MKPLTYNSISFEFQTGPAFGLTHLLPQRTPADLTPAYNIAIKLDLNTLAPLYINTIKQGGTTRGDVVGSSKSFCDNHCPSLLLEEGIRYEGPKDKVAEECVFEFTRFVGEQSLSAPISVILHAVAHVKLNFSVTGIELSPIPICDGTANPSSIMHLRSV